MADAFPLMALETPRLSLRPVRPSDRADLIALEADPEVMRFLNGGAPVPEAGLPDADFLTPRGMEPEVLVAHTRATGAFIGWFALFDDGLQDGLRCAEIGYRLSRSAWGQGLGTEGAGALLNDAFQRLGLDLIRAETAAANHASRRLLEKLGFRLTQTRRDEVIYTRARP